MGGHVGVKSAKGKGSTFTFALPRSARAATRGRPARGLNSDVAEGSTIRELMRHLGVPPQERLVTVAVAAVNLVLGVAYCRLGVMTITEMRRDWGIFGFSRFGAAFIAIAFTCGPHHLFRGIHLAFGGRSGGTLDLVSVLVGVPVAAIWLFLRVATFAGGRGDRYVMGRHDGSGP